jgi:hypothetical protein
MTRAQELAAIVRAAARRLFYCEAHEITRATPETCELCILEQLAHRRGRRTKFRSVRQIMSAPAGIRF